MVAMDGGTLPELFQNIQKSSKWVRFWRLLLIFILFKKMVLRIAAKLQMASFGVLVFGPVYAREIPGRGHVIGGRIAEKRTQDRGRAREVVEAWRVEWGVGLLPLSGELK